MSGEFLLSGDSGNGQSSSKLLFQQSEMIMAPIIFEIYECTLRTHVHVPGLFGQDVVCVSLLIVNI